MYIVSQHNEDLELCQDEVYILQVEAVLLSYRTTSKILSIAYFSGNESKGNKTVLSFEI